MDKAQFERECLAFAGAVLIIDAGLVNFSVAEAKSFLVRLVEVVDVCRERKVYEGKAISYFLRLSKHVVYLFVSPNLTEIYNFLKELVSGYDMKGESLSWLVPIES